MAVSFFISTICNKEQLLAEAIDYTHFHPAAFIAACFSYVFIIFFFIIKAKRAETKKSRPYVGTGLL